MKTYRPVLQIETIRKRRDFVAARKGARISGRFFVLQCHHRKTESARPEHCEKPEDPSITDQTTSRFGLTVTKKNGNAVERNRIKRRLREAIRIVAPQKAVPGCDYVLIAHRATLDGEFNAIVAELAKSLDHARAFKEKAGRK